MSLNDIGDAGSEDAFSENKKVAHIFQTRRSTRNMTLFDISHGTLDIWTIKETITYTYIYIIFLL